MWPGSSALRRRAQPAPSIDRTSRCSPAVPAGAAAGFTLVEVLVAIVVLGVVAAALHANVAAGSAGLRRAAMERAAVAVAQARLEAAGIAVPLTEGSTSGEESGLAWRMTISPWQPPASAVTPRLPSISASSSPSTEPATRDRPPLSAWWVSVDVTWRDGLVAGERSMSLTTVKLAGGQR
jgi:prepilin-type N-terminal cleavage/methylation domain-containing protein